MKIWGKSWILDRVNLDNHSISPAKTPTIRRLLIIPFRKYMTSHTEVRAVLHSFNVFQSYWAESFKGGRGVTVEGRLSCGEIHLSVEWFKCAAGLIHSVHKLQHAPYKTLQFGGWGIFPSPQRGVFSWIKGGTTLQLEYKSHFVLCKAESGESKH